jgi:hypothetical protein
MLGQRPRRRGHARRRIARSRMWRGRRAGRHQLCQPQSDAVGHIVDDIHPDGPGACSVPARTIVKRAQAAIKAAETLRLKGAAVSEGQSISLDLRYGKPVRRAPSPMAVPASRSS